MDRVIEDKWISKWQEKRVFEPDRDLSREKKLVTFPFPYMNGPLHLGHGFTATRVDVFARFKRMQGYNVIFPWAWHWTGQPIVAASERLSNGDKAMITEFVEIDKVPKEDLPKFYDPKFMAQYYTDSGRTALKRLALSIDWRREFHTTDLEPTFNKFVLWQYSRLRQMGYVTQGTHPVVWCPRDQSPTGDHDRLEGQGVQWEEYTLILFRLAGTDAFLPAATFRPETIFGVTNLWINPDSEYAEISVDDSLKWIVSAEAADKLKDQLRTIVILKKFLGSELVGKYVIHPLNREKMLPIFPAKFVKPTNGTGVVYSVPAHAPMDYVALKDLKSNIDEQRKYLLDSSEVEKVLPVSLISVKGMGDFPAQEIIDEMHVKDQLDQRVDEATATLYKREFHQGVLRDNTGKYKGRKVAEAKPLIIKELKEKSLADAMYDLSEKVVCRCLTECRVKILEDQWFLKYSDPEWKKLAHECINSARMYPESTRQWFHDVIDWIKDWPCARRVGLGTPLPWSPGWIVETLSDSTIYMAYYTIRPLIVSNNIGPETLTDDLFNYVFLADGDAKTLSEKVHLAPQLIQEMRNEFLYWYPVNLRNSAKELIPNHLMFFVFQHVAFFPRPLWPTGISANGMMMVEGEKMSKSKGNVITLSNALEVYGSDALRSALMDGAEGLDDMDWREKNARDVHGKISALPSFIRSMLDSTSMSERMESIDLWLENQIQKHIERISVNLDLMKTKSGFQEVFYSYWNDLRYYNSRCEIRNESIVQYAIDVWIRLLAPFIPYTVEEIYQELGREKMVCESSFPEVEESRIHPEAALSELLVQRLVEDSNNILKLMTQKPKSLYIYSSSDWSYDLFGRLIEGRKSNEKTSEILRNFFSARPYIDKKLVANMLNRLSRTINELGEDFLDSYKKSKHLDEKSVYEKAQKYLGSRLGVSVIVSGSEEHDLYDPKNRATFALPFKPAVFFE